MSADEHNDPVPPAGLSPARAASWKATSAEVTDILILLRSSTAADVVFVG